MMGEKVTQIDKAKQGVNTATEHKHLVCDIQSMYINMHILQQAIFAGQNM